MARLNPAPRAEPAALSEYVAPPGRSTADELAVRFDLDPASSVLVVGWIGTGKTTQLLAAQRNLASTPGVIAHYVDVSTRHDLADVKPGVLLALAGIECAVPPNAKPEVAKAAESFGDWAMAVPRETPLDEYFANHYDHEPVHVEKRPQILKPPAPSGIPEVEQRIAELRTLASEQPDGRRPIFFFDSLDRLGDAGQFRMFVKEDLQALRAAGVGAAIVGPPRVLYAADRTEIDLFDKFLEVPIIDGTQGSKGEEFLLEVLRKRAPTTVLPDASARKVVELSGGVIRDLIAIARGAGEEAYLSGVDTISPEHVITAADRFGRSLLLGVREGELQALRKVSPSRPFVPTTEADLSLLQSRRILLLPGGRHVVHPSVARVIGG